MFGNKIKLKTVTDKIIAINIAIFILSMLNTTFFYENFAIFSISSGLFKLHQLVTHMFIHGGILHLILNMVSLFSFGYHVESRIGTKQFIILYLGSGILGGVLGCVLTDGFSVGASGAIFGVLMALAVLYPYEKISILIPTIQFTMWKLVMVVVILSLVMGLAGVADGIGHFSHFGGALFGFLYMVMLHRKLR